MDKNILKHNFFNYLLIAVFAFMAISSAFYNGHPTGNDMPQHYQFAVTIYDSISSGEIYPSFATKAAKGLGDYGIRFYPPLSYYAISAIFGIVGSWYYAGLILFFLVFWISGIGTYLWAKENFENKQSLLAAAIFIFAPYHLNQVYNNFLFAEFIAMAIIPFCFLFITKVCKNGRITDVLGLSISVSLLILTHLPSTIICVFAFSIYSSVLLWKNDFFAKTLLKLIISGCISVVASSFYWIKLISELNWINHNSSEYFSEIYSFQRNFLLAPQNYINFQDDILALWLAEMMLLSILLISIPTFIYIVKNRKNLSAFTIALTIVFISALFLATPLSKFVWSYLPLLHKIQFPYRFLGIISLTGSILASIGIIKCSDQLKESKNILLPFGLGFIFLFFVFSSSFITKQAFYIPKKDFSTSAIMESLNTPSFECWWTVWEKTVNFDEHKEAITADKNAKIIVWQPKKKKFIMPENSGNKVEVLLYYYPHWKAYANDKPVKVSPTDDGLITIENPNGSRQIQLLFEEPRNVVFANYASISVWILIFLTLGFCLLSKTFKAEHKL